MQVATVRWCLVAFMQGQHQGTLTLPHCIGEIHIHGFTQKKMKKRENLLKPNISLNKIQKVHGFLYLMFFKMLPLSGTVQHLYFLNINCRFLSDLWCKYKGRSK